MSTVLLQHAYLHAIDIYFESHVFSKFRLDISELKGIIREHFPSAALSVFYHRVAVYVCQTHHQGLRLNTAVTG